MDTRKQCFTRSSEKQYMIKRAIPLEGTLTVNVYASNNRLSKSIKQKPAELKGRNREIHH